MGNKYRGVAKEEQTHRVLVSRLLPAFALLNNTNTSNLVSIWDQVEPKSKKRGVITSYLARNVFWYDVKNRKDDPDDGWSQINVVERRDLQRGFISFEAG